MKILRESDWLKKTTLMNCLQIIDIDLERFCHEKYFITSQVTKFCKINY